jgi:hypothetical protein
MDSSDGFVFQTLFMPNFLSSTMVCIDFREAPTKPPLSSSGLAHGPSRPVPGTTSSPLGTEDATDPTQTRCTIGATCQFGAPPPVDLHVVNESHLAHAAQASKTFTGEVQTWKGWNQCFVLQPPARS